MTPASFVDSLSSVLGHRDDKVFHLHEPRFGERERELVLSCLDSTFVSSVGRYVEDFEKVLAERAGVPHAIALVNGTAALHLGLVACGVGAGDEVLCPSLSFVATANAIKMAGAEPHFVDVENSRFGIDPNALRQHLEEIAVVRGGQVFNQNSGRPIRALVVMHCFGCIAEMDALKELSDHYGIALVEDAAEALGSERHGRHAGHWGRVAALSFNGNKILTTGGGGALLCRDEKLAMHLRHLSSTAKVPHKWAFFHDQMGFNYRLPNLNAALGLAQMERLDNTLALKKRLHRRYVEQFDRDDDKTLEIWRPEQGGNRWLVTALLKPELSAKREEYLQAAHGRGFYVRPNWELLHQLPMYEDSPRAKLPVSVDLAARIINLPSSPFLAEAG
jgi:perosamine synthetase